MKKLLMLIFIGLALVLTACPEMPTPKPLAKISPDSLEFTSSSAIITIANTGNSSSALTWTAQADSQQKDGQNIAAWFSFSATQGQVAGGDSSNLTLSLHEGLSAGSYSANVTIGSNGGNSKTIPIRATVKPVTTISPDSLELSHLTRSGTITVANTGLGGILPWNAQASNYKKDGQAVTAWLSLNPSQGEATSTARSDITVSAQQGLAAGNYSADITITTTEDGKTTTIPVSYNVQPIAFISPDTLELAWNKDSSANIAIGNGGNAPLQWTAQVSEIQKDGKESPAWFSLASQQGEVASNNSTQLKLTVNANLPSAKYTAKITISSNGGDDKVITVLLEPASLFVPTTPLAFATQNSASFTLQNTANSSTTLDFRISSRDNKRDDTAIEQWYSVTPEQGSIRGGSAQPITLTLKDGIRAAKGVYQSVLCVNYGTNYGLRTCFLITFDNSASTDTGSFNLAYDINNFAIPPVPNNVIIRNVPIKIVRSGNFATAVALEASVAPQSDITASFNPNPATSSSDTSFMTLRIANTVAEGDYVITVKGTADGKVDTVEVPLTVQVQQPPSFSLSLDDTTLSVQTGNSVTTKVKVNPVAGFTGQVTFESVNTPTGITVSFEPASHTSSSTITMTIADNVAADTYLITIKGTSGSLSNQVRLNLTVTPGDPESARIQGMVTTANDISQFSVVQYSQPRQLANLETSAQEEYAPQQILVKYAETGMATLSVAERTAQLEQQALSLQADYGLSTLQAGGYSMPDLLEVNHNDIEALAAQLSRDPRVAYAEPNYYIYLQSLPTDPDYSKEWNMAYSGLPVAWQDVAASSRKTIAVIDSSIDIDHTDFNRVTFYPGYDFCAGQQVQNNIRTCTEDSNPRPDSTADNHGTHVTGIIAASSNNRGMAGVLHQGANIVPVKVFDSSGFTTANALARALRWSAGISVSNAPSNQNPADIINLSLGASRDIDTVKDAVDAVAAKGVLMVAAAGNTAQPQILYPAAYPNVMAVGSVNGKFRRSCFSHYGNGTTNNTIDIMAAGGDFDMSRQNTSITCDAGVRSDAIYSTMPNNGYGTLFGTSQATPLVAGVAALVWQQNSSFSATQLRNHLKNTAYYDRSYMNRNQYGAGIIRADAALGLPSVGDEVSLTATGANKNDSAIDRVTLNHEGTSSSFDLTQLLADSYTVEAVAIKSGKRLSGSITVSLNPAQVLRNQQITITP